MSFKNKVVIVTGASAGIGAAIAVSFAREGAHVAIVGRNEAKLKDVAKQCAAVGAAPLVIKADVANDADAKRIINDTIQKLGKLDVLVNNAGVIEFGTIMDGTILEAYDKIMAINLRAVVHVTMLAAPHLVKTKGNIVNVSSVAGQMQSIPTANAYSVSKAALDHFTRGSALELGALGVRVNTVSPGPVETDMLASFASKFEVQQGQNIQNVLGRVSKSEEIADVILFLASDKAKGITGSVYVSDNGTLLK
ncbi:hypothetical protein ABMA27_008250 [Loxostege sticticalis]|uniref:Ketoreductase domain-containing protein n=1 Tax=Loxostege sticticalis TaxID=481309 RepID=A0ABR3HAT3_LOXSC